MKLDIREKASLRVLCYVFFAFLCLVTFYYSLHNDFLFDDYGLIFQNPSFKDIGHLQWDFLFSSEAKVKGQNFVYFRPMDHSLIFLQTYLFKKNPLGYHLFNLVLFWAGIILIFEFLLFLSGDFLFAFISSILFCVHPVNGVLVNYVTTSGYSLMLICIIAAAFLALKAQRKYLWHYNILGILLFILALLCHEIAIMTPFYVWAALFVQQRRNRKKIIKTIVPYFLILGVYLGFRVTYASLLPILENRVFFDPGQFIHFAGAFSRIVMHYLKNLIFLNEIVLMWSTPGQSTHDFMWIVFLLGFLVILGSLLYLLRKRKEMVFALLWFLGGILPVIFACLSRPSLGIYYSPYWLLFSTLGFCAFIGQEIIQLFRKKKLAVAICLFLVLFLSYLNKSWEYNYLWGNAKAYGQYMLKLSPRLKTVHSWMGSIFLNEKNYPSAKYHFYASLQDVPADAVAYSNLGVIAELENHPDEAIALYNKAIRFPSNTAAAYNNLAGILIERGQLFKAEKFLRHAVEMDYYLTAARKNLGLIYEKKGEKTKALRAYQDILRIDPGDEYAKKKVNELQIK